MANQARQLKPEPVCGNAQQRKDMTPAGKSEKLCVVDCLGAQAMRQQRGLREGHMMFVMPRQQAGARPVD